MVINEREIQFEFRDDGEGGGRFLASGNVITTLRELVTSDNLDEAARLYEGCTENVGEELLRDLAAGASRKLCLQFAEVLADARDFARAARCAELAGDTVAAARFHEEARNFTQSSDHYQQLGMVEKAAEVAERNGDYKRAGELYLRSDNLLRAAQSFERAEDYLQAGKLYVRLEQWPRAGHTLQRVPPESAESVEACWLLGNLYERSGEPHAALTCYLHAAHKMPIGERSLPLYYRLGSAYESTGQVGEALFVFRKIAERDHEYEDVARRLGVLLKKQRGEEEVVELTDPASEPPPPKMTTVDSDFGLLGKLPIFGELSLDDLKLVYGLAKRVSFKPGQTLIKQGQPGKSLFVIVSGTVQVTRTGPSGVPVKLQKLGPGDSVGEMSLIDSALTSADVTASTDIVAFRLALGALGELLSANDQIALRVYRAFLGILSRRLRITSGRLSGSYEAV